MANFWNGVVLQAKTWLQVKDQNLGNLLAQILTIVDLTAAGDKPVECLDQPNDVLLQLDGHDTKFIAVNEFAKIGPWANWPRCEIHNRIVDVPVRLNGWKGWMNEVEAVTDDGLASVQNILELFKCQ